MSPWLSRTPQLPFYDQIALLIFCQGCMTCSGTIYAKGRRGKRTLKIFLVVVLRPFCQGCRLALFTIALQSCFEMLLDDKRETYGNNKVYRGAETPFWEQGEETVANCWKSLVKSTVVSEYESSYLLLECVLKKWFRERKPFYLIFRAYLERSSCRYGSGVRGVFWGIQ